MTLAGTRGLALFLSIFFEIVGAVTSWPLAVCLVTANER